MDSFLSRLRALWGVRWRNIPLAAVSGVVAVGLVGGGVALAVGSPTESATSSVNSAVAEDAVAARGGNANSSDDVAEKQRTAREQSAANRGGGHRNAPKSTNRKESSRITAPNGKSGKAGKADAAPPDRKNAAKEAVAAKPKKWGLPLTEYHLTGRFGQSGNKWSSFHHGLDFAAPTGVPIHAVGSGEISAAGWAGAYGNRVEIRHPDGTVTLYGHMSKILRWSGSVHVGDVIGYVGATGNVTGPHVHLEVRPHGGGLDDAVNPFPWLVDKGLSP